MGKYLTQKMMLAGLLCLSLGASAYGQAPVPRPAGPFDIVQPGGKTTSIPSYKGKVVVVQFLSTICSHCQAFSGELAKMQTELGPKGFQALGVAFVEASPAQTTDYTKRFAKNAFPVGYAELNPVLKYLGLSVMQRVGVPQIIVIDKKGTIRAQSEVGGGGSLGDPASLSKLVSDLMKE